MQFSFTCDAVLLVSMLAVAACSNDATAPKESLAGSYSLASINGSSIPFSYPPDSFASGGDTSVHTSIVGPERITLLPDGTAIDTLSWTDAWTSSAQPWSNYAEHRASKLFGHWKEDGSRVLFLTDSGYTWSDFPYASADTLILAVPDTAHYDKGPRSLLSNQHYQSKSLGAARPPQPYNWIYEKQ